MNGQPYIKIMTLPAPLQGGTGETVWTHYRLPLKTQACSSGQQASFVGDSPGILGRGPQKAISSVSWPPASSSSHRVTLASGVPPGPSDEAESWAPRLPGPALSHGQLQLAEGQADGVFPMSLSREGRWCRRFRKYKQHPRVLKAPLKSHPSTLCSKRYQGKPASR